MRTLTSFILPCTLGLSPLANANLAFGDERIVLGRLELMQIAEIDALAGLAFKAKIDTGAETSSMHAENIVIRSRAAEHKKLKDSEVIDVLIGLSRAHDYAALTQIAYVDFSLRHPLNGELIALSMPLKRFALVKARGQSKSQYRPVVELSLVLAGKSVVSEVNLVDRSGFDAPLLIGKSYLREQAWVDVSFDYRLAKTDLPCVKQRGRGFIAGQPIEVQSTLTTKRNHLLIKDYAIENNHVSLWLDDGSKPISVPLLVVKSTNTSPVVMLPVTLSDEPKARVFMLETQLKKGKTRQLRLGTDSLAQHFYLQFSDEMASTDKLKATKLIAMNETITLDGISLNAKASLGEGISRLYVAHLQHSNEENTVNFSLRDAQGQWQHFNKPVLRSQNLANDPVPVIEAKIILAGVSLNAQLALYESDKASGLHFTPSLVAAPFVINPRRLQGPEPKEYLQAGVIETVAIEGMKLEAKLDTGADVSSLHASELRYFVKNGVDWVSFDYRDRFANVQRFEREVIRYMKVRARKGEVAQPRPVVFMQLDFAGSQQNILVNLQDRARFHYPLILGKNVLGQGYLVGSDESFLLSEPLANK